MKEIISYNVNGIRSALGKGFIYWLDNLHPDIVCLQELKAHPEQFDSKVFEKLGYHAVWHPAERNGYSGVAIFSKRHPDLVVIGMNNSKYDAEGRLIRMDFGDITLINVYIPSGSMGEVRQHFKMKFLDDFFLYINKLKSQRPHLILCGDFNICHKPIDINHPERHEGVSGFLPEERAWFDTLIGNGFIDSFRKFDSRPNQYSWWSFRAGSRARNMGWRIDYHLVSESLDSRIREARIMQDVVHSDHCPVSVKMDF